MEIQLNRKDWTQKLLAKTGGLTLLLLAGGAYAEPVPVTLQTLLEANGRANILSALQQGNHNQLEVLQVGGNEFLAIQSGNANQATVQQLGAGNELLLKQEGNNNAALITQYGEDSSIQLFQYGEANFAIQQLASGEYLTVTQY